MAFVSFLPKLCVKGGNPVPRTRQNLAVRFEVTALAIMAPYGVHVARPCEHLPPVRSQGLYRAQIKPLVR